MMIGRAVPTKSSIYSDSNIKKRVCQLQSLTYSFLRPNLLTHNLLSADRPDEASSGVFKSTFSIHVLCGFIPDIDTEHHLVYTFIIFIHKSIELPEGIGRDTPSLLV